MRVLTVLDRWFHRHLEGVGCFVEPTLTAEEALDLVRHYQFDIVVLNLQLSDMAGTDLIRQLRGRHIATPILALSPSPSVDVRVTALTAGADDVMELPADPAELVARLQALVRRSRGHSHQVLSAGPVSLNLATHTVTVQGQPIHLTKMETAILELLLLRRNLPLSKETFLRHLYADADCEPDPKIVDVFICKIRKKLGDAGAPGMIETSWGRGYVMRTETEDLKTGSRIPAASARVGSFLVDA